jgi:AcrR family transcriptional regulator
MASGDSVETLDPRAVKSRAAMLEAARTLLAEAGWDAITHARVAEKAGVGRATAYRHWPTVNELALEAASIEVEGIHAPPTGDLATDLLVELKYFRSALIERGLKPLMLLVMERAIHDPEFRVIRQQLNQRGGGHLRQLVRDGIRRGAIRRDADLEEVIGLLAGPLIYEVVLQDRSVSDKRLARLVDVVMDAYGAR